MGGNIGMEYIGGALYPRTKLILGAEGENDGDLSLTNPMPVSSDSGDTLYYYNGDGYMEYLCQHHTHGTATSATDWIITKLTYGDDGITNRERLAGSVDGRAGLSWR